MRKTSISMLVLTALATYSAACFASPANPLIRPAGLGVRNAPASATPNLMPPPPPPMQGMNSSFGEQSPGANNKAGTVQAMLSKYAVVAIAGDTAILRMIPGVVSENPGAGGMGMQPQQAQATTTTQGAAAQMLPSFMVKHGRAMLVQDMEVLPEISAGQVVLRSTERNSAVFSGRLDGMSQRSVRGVKLETPDQAYVTRNSPPVSSSTAPVSGNGNSSGNTSPFNQNAGR